MPKASPIQNSFSGGEFGQKVLGRTDSERYKQGLDTCLNYLPTTQGPLIRRPGFKYLNDAKDPSKPPTFIPFKFSAKQNYILEFGDFYVRFYTNAGQILTSGTSYVVTGYTTWSNKTVQNAYNFFGTRSSLSPLASEIIVTNSAVVSGSILELKTPYSYDIASQIKIAQKQDTLWLTCSSIPVFTLQRFGNTSWTLKQFRTLDGPYLQENSYRSPGDNLQTSLDIKFFPVVNPDINDPKVYFQTSPRQLISSITAATSKIRVRTSGSHPYLSGDKVFIAGVAGTTEANNSSILTRESWSVSVVNSSTFDLEDSTFVNAYTGSGVVYPALITNVAKNEDNGRVIGITQGTRRYWGYISGEWSVGVDAPIVGNARDPYELMSPTPASFYMILDRASANSLTNSTTCSIWNLGVWNSSQFSGFPTCVTLHQDRLFLSGTPLYPQQIDASKVGLYNYFNLSEGSSLVVADDNALQFTLASNDLNSVKWMKSDSKGLLAGTIASEWNVTPSTQGTALTPTNFNAAETSSFGASDADAAKVGNALLYIQSGERRVREMNYFFQVDTYRSTDLSELSDHITAPSITRLSSQKEPIPILWALRSDGSLISMVYNRDDTTLKVGWAKHRLGGQSDSAGSPPIVKTMAVIPAPDGTFEQLWIATQRFINGTSVVQIEYMNKFFDESSNQEDAFYLDAGGTYDSPITITSISTGTSLVSAANHGFSNADQVKITEVVGLNSSIVDVDGYIHNSNLVNYHTFVVASAAVNSFFIKDYDGNTIDSRSYSAYVSGGKVRKLVSTISGLTWLKNETVNILADGKIQNKAVVNSAGVLSLESPAAVVQIGYTYNSDAKTLRPDRGSGDGSAIGKLKRVARAAFMVNQVGEISIGPSFNKLTPISEIELFLADQSQSDNLLKLFTGIVRDGLESEFDFNGQFCFRQGAPLPGMIQSLTLMLETNDV